MSIVVARDEVKTDSILWQAFRSCLRYKQAKTWQKPFLNPVRFLRNQWRRRGLVSSAPGRLRQVEAFQLSPFTIVDGETVSEAIGAYGVYEENLTEVFLKLVKPGQVVVDIGMHVGYYAALFARLVGPQGFVHAFE